MKQLIDTYLAVRRAAGFELSNDDYLLRSYARFATEHDETVIRTSTAITWAGKAVSVAQRDARLNAVRRFSRYIRLEDNRHELPPIGYFAHHKKRRLPFIYTNAELTRLIKAALLLRPRGTLRPHTYANLIALLSATGLRIKEALRLEFSDITSEGLLIRETKFRKSRLVPLHDTVVLGLERYLIRRRMVASENDEVFISNRGRPLPYGTVHSTFKRLLANAKVCPPSGLPRPRLHDFRHRFAVNVLQGCSSDRKSTSQNMLALATYLGHANINSTFWYLDATPVLLRNIAIESENFISKGVQL